MLVLNFGVSSVLPAVILFEYPLKKLSVNSIITSEGVLGEIPCGFPLGTQYKFLIPFPFISFLTAFALFKPILISLAAVSSASINLHKSSKVLVYPHQLILQLMHYLVYKNDFLIVLVSSQG